MADEQIRSSVAADGSSGSADPLEGTEPAEDPVGFEAEGVTEPHAASSGSEEDEDEVPGSASPYRSDQIQALDGEGDQFGHLEYVETMVTALEQFPSPYTLGLFGPWGTGKSTILAEVGTRLNDASSSGSALAIFDAWRYEGDSLRREFIREVGEQLQRQKVLNEEKYNLEAELKQFNVAITKPKEGGWSLNLDAVVPALIAASLALVVVLATYFGLPELGASDKTVLKFETAIIGSLAAFVLVVANRVVVPIQVQESRQRFEFPDQFASSFRRMLESVKVERLVIGIDNLDRCSPQRVTEILSTVKGFLEPALTPREDGLRSLCFVIAADDEALRRHLMVEEASRVLIGTEGEADSRAAIEESVDEYLRKFFNASIRITDALDEDMLAFSGRELKNFLALKGLAKTAEGDRLVEMIAQALKRNPRRVKQFVNGLTLRVQLFEDRQDAGRILIEPDILVIAKLAILEEEFRSHFDELRKDNSLLAEWHRQAALPEGEQADLPERLIAFLRFTDDIQPEHLPAYLTQKQTVHERNLPGYGDFTDALEDGRAPTEALEGLAPKDLERHRAAARDYFGRAVGVHAWSRAHNTIRAILATPALGEELAGQVLDAAISQTELKARLSQHNPQDLVAISARRLPPHRFRLLLEALLQSARQGDVENYRSALADVLAANAEILDGPARGKVATAYAADGLREDLVSYIGLAEALPEVVSEQAITEALDQIDGTPIDGGEVPLRFAAAALRRPRTEELVGRFFSIIRQRLTETRDAQAPEYQSLVGALAMMLPKFSTPPGAHGLAEDISTSWPNVTEEQRWISMELALILCAASEEVDQGLGESLGSQAAGLEDKGRLRDWLKENLDRLPASFREGFRSRLEGDIAGLDDPETASAVASVASVLPDDEARELLENAVLAAMRNGHLAVVEALIGGLGDKVRREIVATAADQLQELGRAADQNPQLLSFVVERQSFVRKPQLRRIAQELVAMIVERRETADSLGETIGSIHISNAQARHSLIKPLLDLETAVSDTNRKGFVLSAAKGLAGTRPSNACTAVFKRLNEREEDSDPAVREMAARVRKS